MSILKKTMSITRFKVSDIPSDDNINGIANILMSGFEKCKIQEIDPYEEMTYGWTNTLNNFFPRFDDASFIIGNYVSISLRIDKKSVPASVVKKEVAIQSKKECEKLGVEKLSKAQVAHIKEKIFELLLSNTPAVPKIFDIIWDVENKDLYLFCANNGVIEILEDIMLESFGLHVKMRFPFTMAVESVDENTVSKLKQTSFV